MAEGVGIVSAGGTQWVYQCNRSTFEPISERQIRQDVTLNAPLLGEYARLIRDGKRMRVIANHVEGFALGEAVRDYFAQSKNFLWCEAVPGGDCLLVIVINGEVVVDSRIPPAVIDNAAMEPIALAEVPFDFFVHGPVPIGRPDDPDTSVARLRFESSLINSFTELDVSVLHQLVPRPEYKLLPIKKALAAAKFGAPKGLIAIGIVLAAAAWIFAEDISRTFGLKEVHQEVEYVDPYKDYRVALATPQAGAVVIEAYGLWSFFDTLKTFQPVELSYSGGEFSVKVRRISFDAKAFAQLEAWGKSEGWSVQITGEEAQLKRASAVLPRPMAENIASLTALSAGFVDDMRALITSEVSLGNTEALGSAAKVALTGRVMNATAADVELVGVILNNPYITLTALRLADPIAGLATINFDLIVVGQP